MGWRKKVALGAVTVVVCATAAVAWFTRDPWHPVVTLPVSGKVMLTGVTVVDPRSGAHSPNMVVLIDRGRIVSVGAVDPAPADRSIQRVDATGKFVVPGYNDMHAHPLGPADPSGTLGLLLANGVTGFRQMQGSDTILDERRTSRLPIGKDAPAALLLTGSILTPFNAGTPEEAVETVRTEKAQGADFIKVGMVSRPVLYAVLAEARRLNIPVAGHVPPSVDVVDAARRGMHAIEHLGPSDGALVACSSQHDALRKQLDAIPAMKGPPFKLPLMDKVAGYWLSGLIINPAIATTPEDTARRRIVVASFDEARCRQVARDLVKAGNWQVPTLIRRKSAEQGDDPAFAKDPNLRYMPPAVVQQWRDTTAKYIAKVPAPARALYRQDYALGLRAVKLFDEEGVPMLAGSDVSGGWEVGGFSLHQEFDELARAGLSPLRILQMTTSNAADFLGRADRMGAVAPGMNADLVLLDADPTTDVRNMHRISGVVRAGFYYDRAALDALLARIEAGKGYIK